MEIEEQGKKLKLWVRRKKTGLKLICSRCGQHVLAARIHEVCEPEVPDMPCFEYTTTVVVETYRGKCPGCGIRAERVAQLPSKAPFSKRFEDAVGQTCESAAAPGGAVYGSGRKHVTSHTSEMPKGPLWFGRFPLGIDNPPRAVYRILLFVRRRRETPSGDVCRGANLGAQAGSGDKRIDAQVVKCRPVADLRAERGANELLGDSC